MTIKINKKRIDAIIIQLFFFFLFDCAFIVGGYKDLKIQSLTVIAIFTYIICYYSIYHLTGEIVSAYIMILFLSFAFWFGFPFVYTLGIVSRNSNSAIGMLSIFSNDLVVRAMKYLILSVQAMNVGYTLSCRMESDANSCESLLREKPCRIAIMRNKNVVCEMAQKTYIVLYPIGILFLLKAGSRVLSDRYHGVGVKLQNGFVYQFEILVFYLGLLLLVYEEYDKKHKDITVSLVIYSIAWLTLGSRTTGMGMMASLFIYYFFSSTDKFKMLRRTILFVFIMVVGIVGIGFLRIHSMSMGNISSTLEYIRDDNVIANLFGELGISIVPLLYTMESFGETIPFRSGYSYIIAPLNMIPESFLPTLGSQINSLIYENSCAIWVARHSPFNWLGENFAAEAYMNFGMYGIIVLFVAGIVFGKIFQSFYLQLDNWGKYKYLALSYALATMPRRELSFLVNPLFYIFVVVPGIIWFFHMFDKRN